MSNNIKIKSVSQKIRVKQKINYFNNYNNRDESIAAKKNRQIGQTDTMWWCHHSNNITMDTYHLRGHFWPML